VCRWIVPSEYQAIFWNLRTGPPSRARELCDGFDKDAPYTICGAVPYCNRKQRPADLPGPNNSECLGGHLAPEVGLLAFSSSHSLFKPKSITSHWD